MGTRSQKHLFSFGTMNKIDFELTNWPVSARLVNLWVKNIEALDGDMVSSG